MNKIFKLLILILVFEMFLGYAFYLKRSASISGHYVSATIKLINGVSKLFEKSNKNYKKKILVNKNYPVNPQEAASAITHEEMLIKENKKKCQIYSSQNQHFKVSGITSFKKPIDVQSNLDFLNSFDENKHYLILIVGNSETFGASTKELNNKLHILLQKKLRDKLKSKKIFIVNIAYPGSLISDHLRDLLSFSEIYKPDLAVFYTGGNELYLTNIYKDIVKKYAVNKKNFNTYIFKSNTLLFPNNMQSCLDEDRYLTKNNFDVDNSILDIEKHIKFHFENIKKVLEKKSIEFLFYIQPLDPKATITYLTEVNYPKIRNLTIEDKKFINLNFNDISLELDYSDTFHTLDTKKVSEKLSEDIVSKYKKNILEIIKE